MKAVTVRQPWASAIAAGIKRVETRVWPTAYRGPIAIHAGSSQEGRLAHNYLRTLEDAEAFRAAGLGGWDTLPQGRVVAIAELVDCVRAQTLIGDLTQRELRWGLYAVPERTVWCWVLRDVQPATSRPLGGWQGLWDLPEDWRVVA